MIARGHRASLSFSARYAKGGLLSEATAKIVSASTGCVPSDVRTPKPLVQLTSPVLDQRHAPARDLRDSGHGGDGLLDRHVSAGLPKRLM
jgi:hypothetical protein